MAGRILSTYRFQGRAGQQNSARPTTAQSPNEAKKSQFDFRVVAVDRDYLTNDGVHDGVGRGGEQAGSGGRRPGTSGRKVQMPHLVRAATP